MSDTNMNTQSGWQWPCPNDLLQKISVPIYVCAVGYNKFRSQNEFDQQFQESLNILVEKSAFFGLRNHGSIDSVYKYLHNDLLRTKIKYYPCPTTVISKLYDIEKGKTCKKIAFNCAFDRSESRYTGEEVDIMNSIARIAKKLDNEYQIVYCAHFAGDLRFINYLDKYEVNYQCKDLSMIRSAAEIIYAYSDLTLAVSMRGHAQMIPFGIGTPVLSIITHDKLRWFLDDIGHNEWGIDVLEEDFENKLLSKIDYMLCNRDEVLRDIEDAKDILWEQLMENQSYISSQM